MVVKKRRGGEEGEGTRLGRRRDLGVVVLDRGDEAAKRDARRQLSLCRRRESNDAPADFDRSSGRKASVVHEVAIDLDGGSATLGDTPDDEGLASAAVTSGEDSIDARRELALRRLDVRTTVLLDAEGFDRRFLGTEESKSEENAAGREESAAEVARREGEWTNRSAGKNSSLPGTSAMRQLPSASFSQATRIVLIPLILPLPSETNSLVLIEYSRGSLPKKAATSECPSARAKQEVNKLRTRQRQRKTCSQRGRPWATEARGCRTRASREERGGAQSW